MDNDFDEEYASDPLMQRIGCDPGYRGGKPRLIEAGITVERVLADLGWGRTPEQVRADYSLAQEDIQAVLLYAAWKIGAKPGEDLSR